MEPFAGDPGNFEDWSVWRNFHEAGRLMTTHLHVFLPCVVGLLFPGSLISVVYFQYLTGFDPPDSSFPRSVLGSIIRAVVLVVPTDLMMYASNKALHAMKTTIYGVIDTEKFQNGESPQVLVDLFSCSSRSKRLGGRRPRAVGVSILCFFIWFVCIAVPVAFRFEALATVGMPAWTAFLFTPLLVVVLSFVNLYNVLVITLVVRLWMYASQTSVILT